MGDLWFGRQTVASFGSWGDAVRYWVYMPECADGGYYVGSHRGERPEERWRARLRDRSNGMDVFAAARETRMASGLSEAAGCNRGRASAQRLDASEEGSVDRRQMENIARSRPADARLARDLPRPSVLSDRVQGPHPEGSPKAIVSKDEGLGRATERGYGSSTGMVRAFEEASDGPRPHRAFNRQRPPG
jgi:hypothetical protein